MRWRRNCLSDLVEITSDAHDFINFLASEVNVLSVSAMKKKKRVNGWEIISLVIVCAKGGMVPESMTQCTVSTVTSTVPSTMFSPE